MLICAALAWNCSSSLQGWGRELQPPAICMTTGTMTTRY
jgi:hypothetical protein